LAGLAAVLNSEELAVCDESPEDVAFRADLDRLKAAYGEEKLADAERRGVGDMMLFDALNATLKCNDRPLASRDPSVVLFVEPAEPGWTNPNDEGTPNA
jgi:hypothetical protein